MRLRARLAFPIGLLLLVLGAVTAGAALGATRGRAQDPSPATPALTADQLAALADEATKEVETLRGWAFRKPVRKQMTSLEEMRGFLQQQAEKNLPAARLQVQQAALRTIGLLPPNADLKATWMRVLESQVGGFYVPETKTMHLVARAGIPPFVQRVMLVHELTHALDDQYVDLEAMTKAGDGQTEDRDLTGEAVVEGSATALMMQYAARAVMKAGADLKVLEQYAKEEGERSKVFLEAPRYFSAMLGAYICGTQFLARGQLAAVVLAPDDKAVGEALLAAGKDMPRSTEQILHPDKYWNAATRDEPVVLDDQAAAKWLGQPDRFVVYADTLGEMLTAILTSRAGTPPNVMALQSADAWTNAAAAGWGGDRFFLLSSGATVDAARANLRNVKGVWVTAWDTPNDRDEFVNALPGGSLAPGAVTDRIGDSFAVVYFGVDPTERAALTAKLREQMLPMTKGGKTYTIQ